MDQTDVALRAIVKSLTDTVAPAIDAEDHMAREQLRLSVEFIAFLRTRLHYLHGRERFDLQHGIGLARDLLSADLSAATAEAAALGAALAPAERLIGDPAALTGTIRSAAMDLAHAVAAVVQRASDLPPDVARRIRAAVLAATERRVEFERYWYAPIGFEPVHLDEGRLASFLQ